MSAYCVLSLRSALNPWVHTVSSGWGLPTIMPLPFALFKNKKSSKLRKIWSNLNKAFNPGRSASNMELLRGWTVGSCHAAQLYVTPPRPPFMLWCERKTREPGEPQTARPWGGEGGSSAIAETVKSEDSSVLTLSIRRLEIDRRTVGGTRHQLMYNTGTEAGSEDRTCGI